MAVDNPVWKWLIHRVDEQDQILTRLHWYVSVVAEFCVADAHGIVALEPPDPDNILTHDQMSEELLVGWVKDTIGMVELAALEQQLLEELEARIEEKNQQEEALLEEQEQMGNH